MEKEEMNKEKAITKSWIEKRIHEKAVKRYENEINQAFNQLKYSVVGELYLKNSPKDWVDLPLKDRNDYYYDLKEEIFSDIFEDYDEFKKEKIEKYEQEETDIVLNSITGISDFLGNIDNN